MKINYRANIEASKKLAFEMNLKFKAKVIPYKKKFNKKQERRKNKVKFEY